MYPVLKIYTFLSLIPSDFFIKKFWMVYLLAILFFVLECFRKYPDVSVLFLRLFAGYFIYINVFLNYSCLNSFNFASLGVEGVVDTYCFFSVIAEVLFSILSIGLFFAVILLRKKISFVKSISFYVNIANIFSFIYFIYTTQLMGNILTHFLDPYIPRPILYENPLVFFTAIFTFLVFFLCLLVMERKNIREFYICINGILLNYLNLIFYFLAHPGML